MGKGNDFWLDDPEWEILRRKAEKSPVPKKLKQKASQRPQAKIRRDKPTAKINKEATEKEVVVNLKLSLPKIKLPDFKQMYRLHRRKVISVSASLVVILGIFGSFKLYSAHKASEEAKKPNTPEEQAEEAFRPLAPLEGLTDASGKKSTPAYKFDEKKKVLGYTSEYNGVKLTVSQQALPNQLKTNPGQIEGIARTVNANIPITTQKGKAYLATDDETESQTAIFATQDVLVFIRTDKKLDNDDWIFYINQLNPKQ